MLLKCHQKSCQTCACRNGGLENAFNCGSTLHNTDCHALSSGLFVSGTDIDATAPIGAWIFQRLKRCLPAPEKSCLHPRLIFLVSLASSGWHPGYLFPTDMVSVCCAVLWLSSLHSRGSGNSNWGEVRFPARKKTKGARICSLFCFFLRRHFEGCMNQKKVGWYLEVSMWKHLYGSI